METIPISITDQINPVPNIRTRTFFIIRDQVDEQKLHDALDTLIRRDWRRLGARVVKSQQHGHEYHLPKTFDEKYELFIWSSYVEDSTVDKAIPWLTPPTDGNVAILPSVKEADAIFRPQHWPYDRSDDPVGGPLLYVHLTHYADAGVLSLSMPHIIGDQFGMANLLKAWMKVAGGGSAPEFIENAIPERNISSYSEEESYRKGRIRVKKRFEYPLVILGFLPDLIFNSKEENPIVFLPTALVEAIKERCTKNLVSKYGTDVKLSNGDVISAILTKFARMCDKKSRWISLSQTIQVRNRIPELSGDKMDGFLGNCTVYGTKRFRLGPETPVDEVAYLVRQCINENLEPAELNLSLAITREIAKQGQNTHICEPFEKSYHVTSWPGAWRDLDFSNVVKGTEKPAAEGEDKAPVVQILGQSGERKAPGRFHTTIISKSEDGYWVDFHCQVKAAKILRDRLAKDPKLEKF